mgnify:CR=1 FL=1|tara:strand:+ start:5041 stop:5424 length:384 start_codon:yes stop_codon:yes gene_type:complete
MRTFIILVLGLLAAGCGKSGVESIKEPVKELTKEDAVGSYELKIGEDTYKLVILQNGQGDGYINGKKTAEATWNIAGKELHNMNSLHKNTAVYKLEPSGDLTVIATIEDGKRTDLSKGKQYFYKRIK